MSDAFNNNMAALSVPARTIPVPPTISEQAQAFLARGLPVTPPDIDHRNKEGWRNYVNQVEAQLEPIMAVRANAFPASIARHTLANATLYEITPESLAKGSENRALMHIHGGAFIVGGGKSAAYTAQSFASLVGVRSYSVDTACRRTTPFQRDWMMRWMHTVSCWSATNHNTLPSKAPPPARI